MSDIVKFWLQAYSLPPQRFLALSDDLLAIMAEALAREETTQLRRRLRERERRLPFRAL